MSMITVQGFVRECRWTDDRRSVNGLPVVTLGQHGTEVTVDGMLRGEGHALMRADQLVHLIVGLVSAPGRVMIRELSDAEIPAADSMVLRTMLSSFGYTVELC